MDLSALRNAYQSGGIEECRRYLEKKRDEWKDIRLNVAVIGNSGVGKSSFINAIRRLTADDEGATEVGVNQTTVDILSYSHPRNPLLKFWDLPGVGTDRFPRQTYLRNIGVDRFDFFLLITSTRFTENDTWLGKELRSRNNKYFFIRTKVGHDVSDNKKAHPRTHSEEAVVKGIRESTKKHLTESGCENVSMFLIDSHKVKKFDFELLEHHLVEEFTNIKHAVLALSLRPSSEKMIHLKVAELSSRMWQAAALSCVQRPLAVAGETLTFNLVRVTTEAKFYYQQLALDETSLKHYAELMNCNYQQLESIVHRCLGCTAIDEEEILNMVQQSPQYSEFYEAFEKYSPYMSLFRVLLRKDPMIFAGTYCALKVVLDKMQSAAMEVVKFAAERAVDTDESDSD